MIGNILKLMMTRGLSMKRWNNFPRIEDVSHLDNVGFVLHVALFLANIEEENGNKIDKEFLVKRIIFNSFSGLILSDINSGTKDYILNNDKKIFSILENKALDYLLNFDCPKHLRDDIKNTFTNNNKKIELKIIFASKKYAGYVECQINEKVFSDMYDIPLRTINSHLEKMRKNLKSLDILLSNDNYRKYLSHIRRLSHSMRWNQEKRIFPISVMSHLVITTFLSYVIGMIENEIGGDYDIFDLMMRGLYHDIPEAMTGDIITPTKNAVEGFVKVLEKVEMNMMDDYLFYYVGNNYKNNVFNYMLKPFAGEYGKIVKYADILSALLESRVEVNYGSSDFNDIYRNIKKNVNKFNIISVDYILKYGLDSFNDKNSDINLK